MIISFFKFNPKKLKENNVKKNHFAIFGTGMGFFGV